MKNLYYRSELVGLIEPEEEDPPFYTGYFSETEILTSNAARAYEYLQFCTKEFELNEESPAFAAYEKEKEELFPEFIFSEDWTLGDDSGSMLKINDPMLTKEGIIFWTFTG